VHRPAARRPRRHTGAALTAAVAAIATGCGGGGGGGGRAAVAVVAVEAQPCARPQRDRGLGVVVAAGLVATAAHTVDGDLRALTVDGVPGSVVALDPRTDLAVVRAAVDAEPVAWPSGDVDPIGAATLHLADGSHAVEVVRSGLLVVDDATDRTTYRRLVHTFTPGVAPGVSGAPLTTPDDRLLGVVVLDRRDTDEAHAVTAGELRTLVDAVDRGPAAASDCPD
jgi:S1-C subfamily serine protease